MNTSVLIFVILVFGFFAWRYLKRARRAGRRAIAISEYVSQFSIIDARRLHDLALTGLVTSPLHGSDTNQALEIVVALRDRVDELEGKAHGPANKARIRFTLASAVQPLLKQASPAAGFRVRGQFALGEDIPEDEYETLGLHIASMGHIYNHPYDISEAPKLKKYSSHR